MSGDDEDTARASRRRMQSQTERDAWSENARRQRAQSAAVPATVEREITGVYEGAALREERAKRPTDKRFERLEEKHDQLTKMVLVIVSEASEKRKALWRIVGSVLSGGGLVELLHRMAGC